MEMLSSAGFVLRKWASNSHDLLNSIDSKFRLSNASLNLDNDKTIKTLGVYWNSASVAFFCKINNALSAESMLTKRTLLLHKERIFYPLG